jgi:glycosyltransferase involved in cell wall biosynthesis
MPHELMDDVVFTDSTNYQDLLGDILFVSKSYFIQVMPVLDRLKKAGVKTIIDYDDYWALPQDHLLYSMYKKNGTTKVLIDALREFDYVTTTTKLLADEIRKINRKVHVFENAINPFLYQFANEPEKSDLMRFGWIGGHCHLPDIKLLETSPERLNAVSQNWNIYLFGHDGKPGSLYDQFADIMCSHGKTMDKLKVYRLASSDTYTKFYNLIDVCLVPLVDSKFNSMKSELKMVEAAFFKKGLIVSNVMPYKKWATDKNCLVCDNKTDWFKNMKRLVDNKSLAEDLGNQLYEDLHERFNLMNVNKRRTQFYESIC